jgi:hypothetical protein
LSQDQVDPKVLQDLGIDLDKITLAPIEDSAFDESVELLDQVLRANREAESLEALQQQAQQEEGSEFTLEDGLLLYSSRLVIPETDLRTALIREAYEAAPPSLLLAQYA